VTIPEDVSAEKRPHVTDCMNNKRLLRPANLDALFDLDHEGGTKKVGNGADGPKLAAIDGRLVFVCRTELLE
jgi:hypothetical protein